MYFKQIVEKMINRRRRKKVNMEAMSAATSPANNPTEKITAWATDYFQLARSWADDLYATTIASRNRWRAVSIYVLTPIVLLLLICITLLIPMQHLVPLLINHYENGIVNVVPLEEANIPKNRQLVESDIVRYVINRESYSAYTYKEQYSLINLLSDNDVASVYREEQSSANKNSPINTLGEKGSRTVRVMSVLFLDHSDQNFKRNKSGFQGHHHLAQVNFVITDHSKPDGTETKMPLTALISWDYRGAPKNPEEAWKNWDGFTVTYYEVQQQHVDNE